MLASSGGMERLRAAEKVAKEKRLCLYANLPVSSAASRVDGHSAGGSSRSFDGMVVRVWSGDQLSIVDKDGKERRVQLSSTRAPKCVVPLLLMWLRLNFTCSPGNPILNKLSTQTRHGNS